MLTINKGKKVKPVMAVIYGVEGIGKTTLASQLPGALIVDIEKGSGNYDVARIDNIDSLNDVYNVISDLTDNAEDYHKAGYHTVVFDSIDVLENDYLIPVVVARGGRPGGVLADLEWGKGYDMELKEFTNFIDGCKLLQSKGYNVVMVVHSTVKDATPPDGPSYNHYELKLNKKIGQALKGGVDMVLFAGYHTYLTQDGNKARGKSVSRRLICNHCAFADAKNRYGLPNEIPLNVDQIAPFFAGYKGGEKDDDSKANETAK